MTGGWHHAVFEPQCSQHLLIALYSELSLYLIIAQAFHLLGHGIQQTICFATAARLPTAHGSSSERLSFTAVFGSFKVKRITCMHAPAAASRQLPARKLFIVMANLSTGGCKRENFGLSLCYSITVLASHPPEDGV